MTLSISPQAAAALAAISPITEVDRAAAWNALDKSARGFIMKVAHVPLRPWDVYSQEQKTRLLDTAQMIRDHGNAYGTFR